MKYSTNSGSSYGTSFYSSLTVNDNTATGNSTFNFSNKVSEKTGGFIIDRLKQTDIWTDSASYYKYDDNSDYIPQTSYSGVQCIGLFKQYGNIDMNSCWKDDEYYQILANDGSVIRSGRIRDI